MSIKQSKFTGLGRGRLRKLSSLVDSKADEMDQEMELDENTNTMHRIS